MKTRTHLLGMLATTVLGLAMAYPASAQESQQGAGTVRTPASTLDVVKERGVLNCGVIGSAPNFSLPDSQGVMRGLDADLCRAVATAVLGDPNKVKFVSLTPAQRLVAVQSGEVDVAFAQITWTLTRESKAGVQFPGTYFFDTYGIMVPKVLGVNSVKQLDDASICIVAGPGETNLGEFFGKHKLRYKPVPFSDGEQLRRSFLANRCDAVFHSLAALAAFKGTLGPKGNDYILLEDTHALEPLAGAVRKGDPRWYDVVQYTLNAMINAEELGIDSKNIDNFRDSKDPNVQRLLGTSGDLGQSLGLSNDWAAQIVAKVGNYGEAFERNLGVTGMPRGKNRLAENGGLLYAIPMR